MEEIMNITQDAIDEVRQVRIGSLYLSTIIKAFLILIVCVIVIRILMSVVRKALQKSKKLDAALAHFLESAIKTVLWILAIIIIADSLGISTTSLVALVSVAGLALSLSVQSIMSNLFSGITLLVTKPFIAGDYVDISGKAGTVKSVGLFYTVLDTVDNVRISIPNGDVTSAAVTNYSAEPRRRVDLVFSASYASPTEAVRAAILDAAQADERILADPAPFVAIKEYGSSSISYVVRVWCGGADYWDVYFGMNERVRESFADHGVEMTYDHLNVHMVEK